MNILAQRARLLAGLIVVSQCMFTSQVGAQTIRDSAGIRIVSSDKPLWTSAQQLHLAATPSLVIGNRDEEPYLLSQVRNPFTLSDGRIVLGNAASNELRVYDGKGTYLKAIGRKGNGPGEFQDIERIARIAGDTIAVFHGRSDVSLFTSAGTFIKKLGVARPTDATGRPTSISSALLVLDGATRLVINQPLSRDAGSIGKRFDHTVSHQLLGADGKLIHDLGHLPITESIVEKDGARYVWLCAMEAWTSNGNSFYLGYGREYSIRRYNSRGKLEQIVRRSWTPHKLTKADISTFVEEWLLRWSKTPGPEREKDRADMLDDPYAINLPAFSAILVDLTGRLWVRTPKPIDAAVAGFLNAYSIGQSTWSVFGKDGRWLGDVTMPARFMPSEIGADYVLGVTRDDDGVPSVVRYKLGTS